MSYKHFYVIKRVIFGKLLVTSHTPEGRRDVTPPQWWVSTEDNGRSAGYKELMKGVRALTTGALPWLSHGLLPHLQPKIPAAESHCSNNPHSSHYPPLTPASLHPVPVRPPVNKHN